MANLEQLEILKQGVEVWNSWRSEHLEDKIDFSGADLSGMELCYEDSKKTIVGIDFHEANLSGANFYNANLREANLCNADLYKAYFVHTNLACAKFDDAKFAKTQFHNANLTKADLSYVSLINEDFAYADLAEADLSGAKLNNANLACANLIKTNFFDANITGVNLFCADLHEANFSEVKYDRRKMIGKKLGYYSGIRGLDSCYGNPIFKRDAQDQEYLDSLAFKNFHDWGVAGSEWCNSDSFRSDLGASENLLRAWWQKTLFSFWGLFDYGRSVSSIIIFAILLAAFFGALYGHWDMIFYGKCPDNLYTPFYFSIVTLTTLGFGDVTPKTLAGEICTSTEVVFGYILLGLLLSVLANKFARRS